MKGSDIARRDAESVWHPYTQHSLPPKPIPIASASGAHLTTVDGNRILDCISSWWVTLHGHAHPVIAAAVAQQAAQLEQVIFAGFTHEPAVRLAEELKRILPPGLQRVFYSDDGSTAVEAALKMALQYWRNRGEDRTVVVALENAYHGDTFGAMSVSARGPFTSAFAGKLFEVERLPDPVDGDPAAAFEELLARRRGEVAAIIVEPLLLGAGGMRMWSAVALRRLKELAAAEGVLFIADEVLTGFGRTGPLFSCGGANVAPDIICLSKGLTGGFLPLGATVATEEVFQSFSHQDRRAGYTFYHGHSFTANPLACAAALASIALLDSDCAARRSVIEGVHRSGVSRLVAAAGVGNARVLGTVAAFDLAGEAGYLSDAGAGVARYCLDNGVLIRPLGNVVYLIPPYCIAKDDLLHAYEVIEEALQKCAGVRTQYR